MAQLTRSALVVLVRDLLLMEADEILGGSPDILMAPTEARFTPSAVAARKAAEERMVQEQERATLQHNESRLDIARRLYDQYRHLASKELGKLLRQLPSRSAVLAEALASWADKPGKRAGRPSDRALLNTFAAPDQLVLVRLRAWAERQLRRTQGVQTVDAEVIRIYVYLTLRDVCDWERAHVGASDLDACVTGSFALARDDEYDGFASLVAIGGAE